MIYYFDGLRLKYSTQLKIKPKFWNEEKQQAKSIIKFPQYPEFNQRLKDIETIARNCEYALKKEDPNFTKEDLKEFLDKELRRENLPQTQSFITWLEEQITIKVQHQPNGTSKRVYDALLKHLKGYSEYKKVNLHFNSFDLDFYNKLMHYMIVEQKLSNNTAGKRIATLKTFLNLAIEHELTTNLKFKSRSFKVIKEDVINIYLSLEEINSLKGLDLSKYSSLDKVRDLFLIGCVTGLRFSDFTRIKNENLRQGQDGKTYIYIRTQKTADNVVIPTSIIFWSIWEKYNHSLPRVISNQKMNDYLKEIGKLANLTTKIIKVRTVGGVTKDDIFEKWQMITTHTARRSFATNAYLNGIPSINIMKITGHKTESSFMKYIKVTAEENALIVGNNILFK